MKIITVTPEELADLIRTAVRDALNEVLPEVIKKATEKPYLTTAELCKLLNISRSAQYLRDTRQIDFIQNGKKILYSAEAIRDYMSRHRIKGRSNDYK